MGILTAMRTGSLKLKFFLAVSFGLVTPLIAGPLSASLPLVPKWGRFEQSFRSSTSYSNPLQEATLNLLFISPSGITNRVDGFWDGENTWRARFSPDEVGGWTFRTICSDRANRGLHNHSGEFICTATTATSRFSQHGPIRLARDRRHFEHADGTPFFWVADTVWDGPRNSELKDWQFYTRTRAIQQFTVAQWAVGSGKGARSKSPWIGSPERVAINPDFFQRLDVKLEMLARAGILSAIVPQPNWEMGDSPPTTLPEAQAALLLRYFRARWGADPVVWLLGQQTDEQTRDLSLWKNLGADLFGALPRVPVVWLARNVSRGFDDFRAASWIDAFGFAPVTDFEDKALSSGLTGPFASEWKKEPARPLIVIAPCENGRSQSTRRFTSDDVRHAIYWDLLMAPPAGITYSAQGLIQWDNARKAEISEDLPMWQKCLFLPAAKQMAHLVKFINSTEFWRLRPRPDFVVAQPGNTSPGHYIAAAGTEAKDLSLVYVPEDRTVEILLDALPSAPNVSWLNPRTGESSPAVAVVGTSTCQFPTPDAGDWLLVMKAGR